MRRPCGGILYDIAVDLQNKTSRVPCISGRFRDDGDVGKNANFRVVSPCRRSPRTEKPSRAWTGPRLKPSSDGVVSGPPCCTWRSSRRRLPCTVSATLVCPTDTSLRCEYAAGGGPGLKNNVTGSWVRVVGDPSRVYDLHTNKMHTFFFLLNLLDC